MESQKPPPLASEVFPGGCYLFYNSLINWEGSEKLVEAAMRAYRQGFSSIHLALSSDGGNPDNAFYILNTLRALPLKITTYNLGSLRSAGNIIFMAGHQRIAAPGSTFFFHEAWFEGSGRQNSTSVSKRLQGIQQDDDRFAATIANFSGQSQDIVRDWVARDLTVSSEEAVKLGIAHAALPLIVPSRSLVERIVVG